MPAATSAFLSRPFTISEERELPAQPFAESPLSHEADLVGSYVHTNGENEWILPVEWAETRPQEQAVWDKGMFASQNTGARLRNRFTLDKLAEAFPVAGDYRDAGKD